MSHSLYNCKVFHQRLETKKHRFQYRLQYHLYDLDDLLSKKKESFLFKHNKFGIFSIQDKDYLYKGPDKIEDKLDRAFKQFEIKNDFSKIKLLTCPRYFNYAFNPVSFFFCYRSEEFPAVVLAEVNNTFNEGHIYALKNFSGETEESKNESVPKKFHVSPFFDRDGEYQFSFSPMKEDFEIRMNYSRNGKSVFFSRLWGKQKSFSHWSLLKSAFFAPFGQLLTSPRILWQAAKLYYFKNLRVFRKPPPLDSDTIRSEPDTLKQRLGYYLVTRHLQKSRNDALQIVLPDGRSLQFGDSKVPKPAVIELKSYSFFWNCLWEGDIGFARSFLEGDWKTPDLMRVFEFFLQNEKHSSDNKFRWSVLGSVLNFVKHRLRVNSFLGAAKNVRLHYDLSNDLFESFLDKNLQYSCALFEKEDQSLDEAQLAKMDLLIQKLDLKPGMHILEIGCGWGGLALHMAETTGCRVTGITLSKEQLQFARKWAKRRGLENTVDFTFVDFRGIRGKFDRIVSCEMIEAIGERNLRPYFGSIDRLLKPGGKAVIQAISIANARYRRSRRKADFIQHYVFPGSACPSLEYLMKGVSSGSRFDIIGIEDIGPHYSKTLNLWDKRVTQNKNQIRKLGFDEKFFRLWHYYLKYCEIGFERNLLRNYQIELARPET